MGGYYFNIEISSTETWSPGDSRWTVVSPLPRTVAWASAVSLNNRIYLFGKSIKIIDKVDSDLDYSLKDYN